MSEFDFESEPATHPARFGDISGCVVPLGVSRPDDELTNEDWLVRLVQVRADLCAWMEQDFAECGPKTLLNAIDSAILRLADPALAGAADLSSSGSRAGHSAAPLDDDDDVADSGDEGGESRLAVFGSLETPRNQPLMELVNGDFRDEKRVH